MARTQNAGKGYSLVSKHMKLNIRTNSRATRTRERRRRQTCAVASDRSVSKIEPYRLLAGAGPGPTVRKKSFLGTLLDRVAAWVSARLWRKTVVGYQDELGFHYGPHPANKDHQAACE